jgi:hypothetical protein
MAIIRRWDLNADAKLNKTEFYDAITPQEAYTKKVAKSKQQQIKRPSSSKARPLLVITNQMF